MGWRLAPLRPRLQAAATIAAKSDVARDWIWGAAAELGKVPLPPQAVIDASHISVAAEHGIELILTWNCKHIANPALQKRIESVCRELGCEPPVICTPHELLEINDVP